MALITCPECEKNVSSSADICPNCGFPIKEFVEKKEKEEAELLEYRATHKDIVFDNDSWLHLFFMYDYIVDRLSKASNEILKYEKIWFDQGVPSYPLVFFNSLWRCLKDGYVDIIRFISKEINTFTNIEIRDNVKSLKQYNFEDTMRSILSRWNHLVMDPFDNNSPAILQEADYNYARDVAQKSQMGFGLITNSLSAMTLYAVQSSAKEMKAKRLAEKNRNDYINSAMSFLQQNVASAWYEHFPEFIEDIELLHMIVISDMSEIVFNGYAFSWFNVDAELKKPERKLYFETKKKQRQTEIAEARRRRIDELNSKRREYIASKLQLIDTEKDELLDYQIEYNSLLSAHFGKKLARKKVLCRLIDTKKAVIQQNEALIERAKKNLNIRNLSYVHCVTNGDKYKKTRIHSICRIVYNDVTTRYNVINEDGVLVEELPLAFTGQYGVYREFVARFDNYVATESANGSYEKVFLTITSVE